MTGSDLLRTIAGIMGIGILLAVGVLFAGCTQGIPGGQPTTPLPGGDRDEHGCITSAGYTWCNATSTCIRRWMEQCPGEEQIDSFAKCVAAGYPVKESYPRQCTIPNGPTFVEETLRVMCEAARGHWNDCGSRCMLDNQGKTGVACPAMCEQLCECGGIAGFGCPTGFECRMPAGIPDALGYCVASGAPPTATVTPKSGLTRNEAFAIAKKQPSACLAEGNLRDIASYNAITQTWWIDLAPANPKEGCNPACVVSEVTKTAEVNWRCTGGRV